MVFNAKLLIGEVRMGSLKDALTLNGHAELLKALKDVNIHKPNDVLQVMVKKMPMISGYCWSVRPGRTSGMTKLRLHDTVVGRIIGQCEVTRHGWIRAA